MANAQAGDVIEVGPGRYGDIDGDGTFVDPGEEPAQIGFGCVCMIRIDKPLTIQSTDGDAVTILDAGAADVRAVVIEADGVVFGKRGHGFTVMRARRDGILLGALTFNITVI